MSRYDKFKSGNTFDIPSTMQAVIACGAGFENLKVARVPVPEPGPDQLLARVDAAGVCSSILKLVKQGDEHMFINGWDMTRWPVILGDEGSVTLVRIGSNLLDRFRIGQRYAIQPAVDIPPITHRERYRKQAEDMKKCAVGYTLPGHLAQYILIQQEVISGGCMLPVPDEHMPYFCASMAEPISCITSAQERNIHIIKKGPNSSREPVLGMLRSGVTVIRGAGPMGRMHAELALRFSPAVLIVADHEQARLDQVTKNIGSKAAESGCRIYCISPDSLEQVIMEQSGGRGADDYILALGIQEEQQRALGLLAPGGVANLFGGLPKGRHILELDALDVHYREIKVVGSSGGDPSDLAGALSAIAAGDINPGNYIAAVGSIDNTINVLKMIRDKQIEGKAILYPHIKSTPLTTVESWNSESEVSLLNDRLT